MKATTPDQFVIKLDPSTGVQVSLAARRAGVSTAESITLDMEFEQQGGEGATPYEVLLNAAMQGQGMRFTRQDAVEQQWRIMQPLLDAPPPVHGYARASWGPSAADQLVADNGGWRGPWIVT
jgi:glucose-6-phosphate 1-dehydrogenase